LLTLFLEEQCSIQASFRIFSIREVLKALEIEFERLRFRYNVLCPSRNNNLRALMQGLISLFSIIPPSRGEYGKLSNLLRPGAVNK